ncbi:nuclear envelope integral membrane protein 2 isoform X1 [Oncorhynchus keta]|uniref:nuclear envelope integral membrane protein 2 isoform X1 n=1 Tax=Oncorhynchus keta TaxID=8018 RepID=UPI0015FB7584|nr:nuclear envelope integral membrane protein 2 isoform X1 [Oncorhynchus keta]
MNPCSDISILSILAVLANVVCVQVEGSLGFSDADCTYLKENQNTTHFGTRCFCYNSGTVIKWKDIWSTFQVRVTGEEGVYIVYPMEGTRNCYEPGHFLTLSWCLVNHYWPPSPSVAREKSLDIPLEQEDVCFMVKTPRANSEHSLHVRGKRLNKIRFGLFACGLALFYFAGALCRSSLFFYSSGISVGVLSMVVFLLLILKNAIPRAMFITLFGAGSGLSYLGYQTLFNHWEDITTLYWKHALGYLVVTGLISWVVCYKHGPISSERTLSLLTWGLQCLAMGLMYYGVTYPQASYLLLGILLVFKALPYAYRLLLGTCRLTGHLLSSLLRVFGRSRKPQVRLLTDEEYREQGEVHTTASLEELRRLCTTPGFPAWEMVLRLRSPQRFAAFLTGGGHVTLGEQQNHGQQYGPGAANNEDMLFTSAQHRVLGLGTDEDLSEDEMDSSVRAPPTPSPLPLYTPTTPTTMPRPDSSAPWLPPPYPAPFYPPYPPTPAAFTPPLEPHVIEDVEEEDMELF